MPAKLKLEGMILGCTHRENTLLFLADICGQAPLFGEIAVEIDKEKFQKVLDFLLG